jgi:GT2 family glycosyltransferase
MALAAARASADRFAEIVVVDNDSQDGSVDAVEHEYPGVRVVRLPANLGAGRARNEGLREVRQDRILFIDNDVSLTTACVDELGAALDSHPRAALAAASIVYALRRDTIQYDGAGCHFLGQQILLHEDCPVASVDRTVRAIGSLSTCCFMADRRRLPSGVTFDESFFDMFEDHDFGVRTPSSGADILSVPAAHSYHGQGTEGLSIRQLGTYSSRRACYLIRNRWLVVLKNYSVRTLLVLTPVFLIHELAQFTIAARKGWLGELWRAATWVLRNARAIWRERRVVQSMRRVPDRELLRGGRIPFRSELTSGAFEQAARRVLDAVVVAYWKLAGRLI